MPGGLPLFTRSQRGRRHLRRSSRAAALRALPALHSYLISRRAGGRRPADTWVNEREPKKDPASPALPATTAHHLRCLRHRCVRCVKEAVSHTVTACPVVLPVRLSQSCNAEVRSVGVRDNPNPSTSKDIARWPVSVSNLTLLVDPRNHFRVRSISKCVVSSGTSAAVMRRQYC